MRKILGLSLCLALATAGPASGQGQGTAPRTPLDPTVLHAQVILDHLGFSPGVLDGRSGRSFTAALKGFQEAWDLPVTGELDQRTLRKLHAWRALRPVKRLRLTEAALSGPFVNPMPEEPEDQAKLPALGYRDALEKLAEMFHTKPEVIAELNPGAQLVPGAILRFPNALPTSRSYAPDLDPKWRQTLNDLNVDAVQPQADSIVVDKSDKVLRVLDAEGKLIAQFSATMGSKHDPLPIGTWKIQGESVNPPFDYNPDLFWDADDGDSKVRLPPGPNGPVGVVWLDLDKPHYGIHGTPEPQLIGRSESHGCIRLANWDAARLALMVKPGTPAVFRE